MSRTAWPKAVLSVRGRAVVCGSAPAALGATGSADGRVAAGFGGGLSAGDATAGADAELAGAP
jgi:hypothetical protein